MRLKKMIVFLLLLLIAVKILTDFISAWPFIMIAGVVFGLSWLMKTRNPYSNFALLFAAIVLAISSGEIIMRIAGKNLTYSEQSESSFFHIFRTDYESPFTPQEQGWLHIQGQNPFIPRKFQANNEGLYDINRSLVKSKKHRVIILGDSFTQGIGSTHDSSYVKLLENDTLEVMNAGMSGSDPGFELKLLELRMLKYAPDVVVMSVNNSDIYDFITRGGMERFLPDSTVKFKKGPWWESIYGNSFIARSIARNIYKLDWAFMTEQEAGQAKEIALHQLEETIVLANQDCLSRKIRFIANFHPILSEIYHGRMECEPVMYNLKNRGVETFNMLDYFINHGIDSASATNYYWQHDGHNNNRGYAVMADGLATLFHSH